CAICTQEWVEKTKLMAEEKIRPSSDGLSEAIVNGSPHLANTTSSNKEEEPDHLATTIAHNPSPSLNRVQLSIGGMTCASCISAITCAAYWYFLKKKLGLEWWLGLVRVTFRGVEDITNELGLGPEDIAETAFL